LSLLVQPMNDRRRHSRTDCRISACIEQAGIALKDSYCRTGNIGMKGVFLPKAIHRPLGTVCKLIIHDHNQEPLKIDARVTHLGNGGVGFTFTKTATTENQRLKNIVDPQWDGRDFMEGMMLMLRYSQPATELKDCLSLTTALSAQSHLFNHTKSIF
jgi:hypothetical protein